MKSSMVSLLTLLAAFALLLAGTAAMGLLSPQSFGSDANGKNVTVSVDEVFRVALPENPSTGYSWDIKTTDGLVRLSDKYTPLDSSGLRVGVGGTHTWEFRGTKAGSETITGAYRQLWNDSGVAQETYALYVKVKPAGLLSRLLHVTLPVLSPDIMHNMLRPGSNISIMPTKGPEASPMATMVPIPRPSSTETMPIPPPPSVPRIPASPAPDSPPAPRTIDLSYGAVPAGASVSARVGDTIKLSLPENPSTGYSWQLTWSDGLEKVGDNYIQGGGPGVVGAGGTHVWTFAVKKAGAGTISGIYKRPWEASSQGEKRYVLDVNAV